MQATYQLQRPSWTRMVANFQWPGARASPPCRPHMELWSRYCSAQAAMAPRRRCAAEGLPVGLRRVGRSEQGDNADEHMKSSPTMRTSNARDSMVSGVAMRPPRSSSGGHEESAASERSTASAIQWGGVTETAVPSNREQPTRGGRAVDPSGVCDLLAANVRRGDSRSRKRKRMGGGNAAVILPPDEAGDKCSQGQPAAGGVHFRWVASGYTFVGLMLHEECRVKQSPSPDR